MSKQGTNNNEEHSSDDALNGQNPLFVIAVFLFIAGVGFFVGMDALREYRLQIDAFERFVPVEAKILRAEIAVRRNNNTNRNSYHPAIRYAYAVDGKVYKSRTYSYFQGNRGARSKAEAIVAAHPVDARVTAYVDPSDPERAVLDNQRPVDAWKVMAFFTAFFGILLFIGAVIVKTLFFSSRPQSLP